MQTDKTSLRKCFDNMKPGAELVRRLVFNVKLNFTQTEQAIKALTPARNIKGKAGDHVREALKILEG